MTVYVLTPAPGPDPPGFEPERTFVLRLVSPLLAPRPYATFAGRAWARLRHDPVFAWGDVVYFRVPGVAYNLRVPVALAGRPFQARFRRGGLMVVRALTPRFRPLHRQRGDS